jgi:hypothetical protein
LRIEAGAEPGRSFDSLAGALEKRDRSFLLGKPVGKDRRSVDARLDLCAAFRRKRPVRERCKLGSPTSVGLFLAPSSHPHGELHGTSAGDCIWVLTPTKTPRGGSVFPPLPARPLRE